MAIRGSKLWNSIKTWIKGGDQKKPERPRIYHPELRLKDVVRAPAPKMPAWYHAHRRPSAAPLKAWCKARGLNWRSHLEQYPLARMVYLGR